MDKKTFIGIGILAIIGIVLISGCLEEKESKYLGMSVEEIKSNALDVSYNDLMLYENAYIGKIIRFRGEIYEQTQHSYKIYVKTLDNNENEIEIFPCEDLVFQEGDIINIWGEFYGVHTYKTFTSETSYPAIYQLHIEKSQNSKISTSEDQKGKATDLLTYIDESNGFSISYPRDWEEMPREIWKGVQTEEGEILIAFWSPYPHKLNFIVWKEELSYPMNIQNYYEVKKEKVKERALMLNNYAFISAEDLAIDGIPAKKDIFTHSTPSGRPSKSMYVYMVKNQTAWVISFSGEPASFDDFKSTFDAIISSLSLQE